MARNPRLHIRVSETNHRKVKQFSAEHGVHVGNLIDEALTLLFTPPEGRPDAAIIQRLERVEDQIHLNNENPEKHKFKKNEVPGYKKFLEKSITGDGDDDVFQITEI